MQCLECGGTYNRGVLTFRVSVPTGGTEIIRIPAEICDKCHGALFDISGAKQYGELYKQNATEVTGTCR